MDRIENDAPKNSSIVAYIRCRGNVFAESLPSNGKEQYTYRQQGDFISLLLFFQNKESDLKQPTHANK
jgi:hypothetical protein